MAKEFAKEFYNGHAWKHTRNAYAKSKGWLCECCLGKGLYVKGTIVHHKQHLTPDNIADESIALSWDNLQLVCRSCHAEIHERGDVKRYKVDELGRLL